MNLSLEAFGPPAGPPPETDPDDFFVWVSPKDWFVQRSLEEAGYFTGGPLLAPDDDPRRLLFVPNSDCPDREALTPFHLNIVKNYQIEYALDLVRWQHYRDKPSRLFALFLLPSEDEAELYRRTHADHVGGRVLKRGRAVGPHRYSTHDAGWIDFLREAPDLDDETFSRCAHAYWLGQRVGGDVALPDGTPWRGCSVREVLFYGKLGFPDTTLRSAEVELQVRLAPDLAENLDGFAKRHLPEATSRADAIRMIVAEWVAARTKT